MKSFLVHIRRLLEFKAIYRGLFLDDASEEVWSGSQNRFVTHELKVLIAKAYVLVLFIFTETFHVSQNLKLWGSAVVSRGDLILNLEFKASTW
jgi:hypothetical protein